MGGGFGGFVEREYNPHFGKQWGAVEFGGYLMQVVESVMATLDRPSVRTTVPGPQSMVLLERQHRHESNVRSYPRRIPIAIRRGSGGYVEDLDGNVYIDFLNGAGALPLGHGHPELLDAV